MHTNGSRHSPGLRLVRGIVPPYQPILGVPKSRPSRLFRRANLW
jgi:hypothetical protein